MSDLKINRQHYLDRSDFIQWCVDNGYTRVNLVMEPGEFAVRGSIIDVFSFNHSHPIRLDYFGDVLDRLNTFDSHTQRSLNALDEIIVYPSTADDGIFSHSEFVSEDHELLVQLNDGDFVVHETHGVGVYKGLKHVSRAGSEGEYIYIEYKGHDKLFMPLDQIHLLHKFSEGEGVPKLNKLYDGSWKRRTERTKRALDELVQDIYELVKKRQEIAGFACSEDSEAQLLFENEFQYDETPDQLSAVRDIKKDMESTIPMDRLLCGDVGFGKTEVLIRAAFKAFDNLKQVVVLVPTTILAEQHYHYFNKRFEGFTCRIQTLSGFKSKSEQKKVIEDLKQHQCDIVIGTHRLLQKDIEFSDLGLLIVDEEQRFGVTHKEKIKRLSELVDCLSVSATPIPRTMYMSLTGSRSISLITTPPKGRLSIETVVNQFDSQLIKSAIENEINRDGQIYYVFNDIDRFLEKKSLLMTILPQLKIASIHGRMKSAEIEKTLHDFYHQEYDVLLSTTIIENGLDIPNVNTIILDKAENFGLSQIHQIRGRVGRSTKKGYAFLLFSDFERLTDKAVQRFRAIQAYVTLGAGYELAMKDLEIRGAGTLLGEKQHGHVTSVGFELYCKLLKEAVEKRDHRLGLEPSSKLKPLKRLKKSMSFYIPDTYISDAKQRLAIYKKIMEFDLKTEVDFLLEELNDRFGTCPSSVTYLLESLKSYLPEY